MTGGRFRAALICAPLACAALWAGSAAHAAGQSGTSRALTIRPLGIVKTQDLDFGTMLPGTGGNVSINAQTGARTTSGPVLAGGTPGAGRFTIAATPLRIVTLALNPNNNLVLTHTGGTGATMVVQQFRVSWAGGGAVPVGPNFAIPLSGLTTLQVGARLSIAPNQMEGAYQGDFTVTLDYQ